MSCPCGLPQPYDECCGRRHRGTAPATAELLMRSRFSAYAVGDEAYLLATWHPTTRPIRLRLDPAVHWERLVVLATTGGGLLDTEGTVDFRAEHTTGVLRENSRFVRHGGRWSYLGAGV